MEGEPPDVYDVSTPKAKKQHTCCECRGFIEPGEKYQRVRGLWDHEWLNFKTCLDCVILRDEISGERRWGEGPAFVHLYEDIFGEEDESPDRVFRFMDIRRKRNAPESPKRWMEEREAELREVLASKTAA